VQLFRASARSGWRWICVSLTLVWRRHPCLLESSIPTDVSTPTPPNVVLHRISGKQTPGSRSRFEILVNSDVWVDLKRIFETSWMTGKPVGPTIS